MPRRMIDPGFWINEQVNSLPMVGRVLFIGMFSNADDDGRLVASPKMLKHKIFPFDEIGLQEVESLRNQIAKLGLIRLYSKDGKDYLDLPTWTKYQHIRADRYRPSILPAFDDGIEINLASWQPTDNQADTTPQPPDNQETTNRGRSISISPSISLSRDINIPTVSPSAPVAEIEEIETDELNSETESPEVETKPTKTETARIKPFQREVGQFLDMVEKEAGVKILARPKTINIVRSLLFKIPDTTPEKLLEFYKWLKVNDEFFRERAPPQVIGGMIDRYPSWVAGKYKPIKGGSFGGGQKDQRKNDTDQRYTQGPKAEELSRGVKPWGRYPGSNQAGTEVPEMQRPTLGSSSESGRSP